MGAAWENWLCAFDNYMNGMLLLLGTTVDAPDMHRVNDECSDDQVSGRPLPHGRLVLVMLVATALRYSIN